MNRIQKSCIDANKKTKKLVLAFFEPIVRWTKSHILIQLNWLLFLTHPSYKFLFLWKHVDLFFKKISIIFPSSKELRELFQPQNQISMVYARIIQPLPEPWFSAIISWNEHIYTQLRIPRWSNTYAWAYKYQHIHMDLLTPRNYRIFRFWHFTYFTLLHPVKSTLAYWKVLPIISLVVRSIKCSKKPDSTKHNRSCHFS